MLMEMAIEIWRFLKFQVAEIARSPMLFFTETDKELLLLLSHC